MFIVYCLLFIVYCLLFALYCSVVPGSLPTKPPTKSHSYSNKTMSGTVPSSLPHFPPSFPSYLIPSSFFFHTLLFLPLPLPLPSLPLPSLPVLFSSLLFLSPPSFASFYYITNRLKITTNMISSCLRLNFFSLCEFAERKVSSLSTTQVRNKIK